VGSLEDTHCPRCQTTLIRRIGYMIESNLITSEGTCPKCGEKIAGVWN
jgi:pyruvate formate lyase activating enzyme